MPTPTEPSRLAGRGHRSARPRTQHLRHQRHPSSQRQWLTTPLGAPNVLLVLIDGRPYGASASGGPGLMPTADLAEEGLRSTRLHAAALRVPARTALMNGPDGHTGEVGDGVEVSTMTPAYDGLGADSAVMLAKILDRDGYATGAFGTSHRTWRVEQGAGDGPSSVDPSRAEEEARHLAASVVERSICWIGELRASSPQKPWFLHLSFDAALAGHTEAQVERFLRHLQLTGELDSTIMLH